MAAVFCECMEMRMCVCVRFTPVISLLNFMTISGHIVNEVDVKCIHISIMIHEFVMIMKTINIHFIFFGNYRNEWCVCVCVSGKQKSDKYSTNDDDHCVCFVQEWLLLSHRIQFAIQFFPFIKDLQFNLLLLFFRCPQFSHWPLFAPSPPITRFVSKVLFSIIQSSVSFCNCTIISIDEWTLRKCRGWRNCGFWLMNVCEHVLCYAECVCVCVPWKYDQWNLYTHANLYIDAKQMC